MLNRFQCSLPQRIRAGCDLNGINLFGCACLCHSAFARVATTPERQRFTIAHLCHSAFARVATEDMKRTAATYNFATAHSRGLRRDLPIDSVICSNFATAHSRGLRRSNLRASSSSFPLPQRIRAGYDAEGKIAIADYVNLATAHSRGLRLSHLCLGIRTQKPCHSAFARVTTAEKQCSALRICCEKVDSFSSVGESGLALTIFPFSFAAKATYVAINDSFGRAIDRFFWCEPHRN